MRPRLTLGILAGGRGSRFGGRDKGWLLRDGEPQIARLLRVLRPGVDRVVISANRNIEAYAAIASVVSDEHPGHPGPMAGVQALLDAAREGFLLTVPVDAANVPDDYAPRMLEARDESEHSVVVAQDDAGLQPLFALYPAALAPHAREAFARGERSVRDWQHRFPVLPCRFEGVAFGNINSPEDLRAC